MSKTKIKNIAVAASLLVIFFIASIMAYFTSTDIVTNRLTVGDVKIELTETKYTDSTNKVLAAGQLMDKNPVVINRGKNDVFVFLEVIVPLDTEHTLIDGDGKKIANAAAPIELFNFRSSYTGKSTKTTANGSDVTIFEYSPNWVLLNDYTGNLDGNKQKRYLFGYRERLSTSEYTNELFDSVQLKDILEAGGLSLQDTELLYDKIIVNAYGIQCDEVDSRVTKDTELIPEASAEAILSNFWDKYNETVANADE